MPSIYLENHESLFNYKVIVDAFIHKRAKLSRKEFIEKVKFVKNIRTKRNEYFISFYPSSLTEYTNLTKFHAIINDAKKFEVEDGSHIVFAIAIQPKLYEWFKTNSINKIQKQIVSWLAAQYFFDLMKKNYLMDEQIYPLVLDEIKGIVKKYYSDFALPDFDIESTHEEDFEACEKKYLEVCKEIYNDTPPEFLSSPFGYERIKEWGVNSRYNFEFIQSYFRDDDWEKIIKKGSEDDMGRVESRSDMWDKWKFTYSMYEETGKNVYDIYISNDEDLNSQSSAKKIKF